MAGNREEREAFGGEPVRKKGFLGGREESSWGEGQFRGQERGSRLYRKT